MIFDILILLGLGIISALGVNMAYRSHRHFVRVQTFAELHLSLAEESKKQMVEINKELKNVRVSMSTEVSELKSICPYGRQHCSVCKGSGECILDRTSTRSQKEGK